MFQLATSAELTCYSSLLAFVTVTAAVTELRRRTLRNSPASPKEAFEQNLDHTGHRSSVWSIVVSICGGIVLLFIVLTGWTWLPLKFAPGAQSQTCTIMSGVDRARFYSNLGGFTHTVLTFSPTAQKLIEAGFLEEWNYNQVEALQSFRLAAELDPSASMAPFGEAYALGPGANRALTNTRMPYPSFSPDDLPACREASKRAMRLAQAALAAKPNSDLAKKELAYASAAMHRFEADHEDSAWAAAESSYGIAFRDIGQTWQDPHALAMAAEAFMNVRQWDYQHENGTLTWAAQQAHELILEVLHVQPHNPLALHLHMHLVEATSALRAEQLTAAEAEGSAERIAFGKGPWWIGFGHLLHMPSHIFLRIGRYHDAVQANIHAYAADLADEGRCQTPYGPDHNMAMLISAAAMAGEVGTAETYSRRLTNLAKNFPQATVAAGGPHREASFLLLTWTMHGRWQDILKSPHPGPDDRGLCPARTNAYALAVWQFARTMALAAAAGGASPAAAAQNVTDELAALEAAAANIDPEEPTVPGLGMGIYGCDYHSLGTIYVLVGRARLLILKGQPAAAEGLLKQAVQIEKGMGYMEPPRLLQPVRHYLGYLLLHLGRFQDAQQVFEEDLVEHPDNGFALHGLIQSLNAQSPLSHGTADLRLKLQTALEHADVPLTSACPAFAS
ncbi:hypothetical protein WJX84_008714 [Apatococcus fuscideae]|uniref:Uncharacterized protein n=1 Tax=Apatococcus fuscideae TaxID=2026836 RepID=A0AAW1TG05_9CHLO